MPDPITYPWSDAPERGTAREVAPGILWIRMPLPMALDHVNIYALDDGDGWTLIDTGIASAKSREIWEAILAGPLGGKPVHRILLTHHHPDHCGLVGWFMERGASLATSRTAYLMARMLTLDVQESWPAETVRFYRRAGMAEAVLTERLAQRPFNFADGVVPLPLGFTRLQEGDAFDAGFHCKRGFS